MRDYSLNWTLADVAALLRGRVMVAHNARFDYDFLAHEFARAGLRLPVDQRLCTLALNRRLSPPTRNMRLGTLAAHYGVVQRKAHDAADDTRVLAGVLRGSLEEAARLGLSLPLVPCPPRQVPKPARAPKAPCPHRNPGRLPTGGPLVQGMKVAITGDTRTARAELTAKGAAAIDGTATFGTLGAVEITVAPGSSEAPLAQATLDAATTERTMLLAEVYPRPGAYAQSAKATTTP